MNKRWAVAGAVAAIVSIGAGTTAGAAPKDKAETFTCDGQETTFIVGGRNGFLDGVHYLAHNLVVEGTFDPTGPAPAEPFRDEQWTSGRTGGLQCTATVTETVPRAWRRTPSGSTPSPLQLISPSRRTEKPSLRRGLRRVTPSSGRSDPRC